MVHPASVRGVPYREVKELRHATYAPEDLDCSLSLLGYMRHQAKKKKDPLPEATPAVAAQDWMLGLRDDFDAIGDAVTALAQRYMAGEKPAPIFVLATQSPSGQWHPAGSVVDTIFRPFVIDGAIRALAAIEARVTMAKLREKDDKKERQEKNGNRGDKKDGKQDAPTPVVVAPTVEVVHIAPTHPDTPPELLFLYLNGDHGVRLSVKRRNKIVLHVADRYRHGTTGSPNKDAVAEWLSPRCGLATDTIKDVIKSSFGVRAPEKRDEAVQRMREGMSPTEAAATYGGSRQANKRAYDRAVRRGQLGTPSGNGHQPATAGAIHAATISGVDAREAADSLKNVLAHIVVDPGPLVSETVAKLKPIVRRAVKDPDADLTPLCMEIRQAFTHVLAHADSAFKRALTQLKAITVEADKYTPKEALMVWRPVRPFLSALLRLGVRWQIWLNPNIAQDDLTALEAAYTMAARTVAAHTVDHAHTRAAAR